MELSSGYGSGDGYGSGYGDGSGYGSGDGYGSGYGSGYGDGSGYGSGDGYGSGYGSGDGYGYGSGDGYGSGYGDSVIADYFDALLKPYYKPGVEVAFWRSTVEGRPANGGRGTEARVGQVEEIGGGLQICKHGFHGTLNPRKWKGDRWWIVALYEPVQKQEDKIASLKREFLRDLGRCPF